MAERRTITTRAGLARRLLRWARGIVYNSALYGFVIWCVGCVIPTPLDRAPAPTNYPPVFVTTRVTPAFGPVTESLSSPGTTIALAATDPNTADTLKVVLFQPDLANPGTFDSIGYMATLMIPSPPDSEDSNLRLGTIDDAKLCRNARDGDKFDVYAFVADRDFNNPPANITQAAGGLTDSNHWEVTCSAM